ncbi:MAG: thioredoxin [Bacteroidia bacterium]|nr:thioredoxin [Bacteroidia bacterium]
MDKKATFGDLIKGDKPVLVDFFATWCGPCHAMNPVIQEVSHELQDKAHVIKVDVDKNRAAAEKFGIMGVPTFMIFKDGQIKWKQSGVLPKAQLIAAIEDNS